VIYLSKLTIGQISVHGSNSKSNERRCNCPYLKTHHSNSHDRTTIYVFALINNSLFSLDDVLLAYVGSMDKIIPCFESQSRSLSIGGFLSFLV
jgi:hypothetical protein